MVDPDDDALDRAVGAVSPHRIQLHGDESPARGRYQTAHATPIIKALGVSSAKDLEATQAYEGVADWFLFDAKPTDDGLPGGNGEAFDWQVLDAFAGATPWLLAGGLTPDNVGQAVSTTRAPMVDVSSGVEAAPGEKDADLMRAFVDAAKQGHQA